RAQLIGGGLTRTQHQAFANALPAQQERLDGLALVPPLGREVEEKLVEPVPGAAERGQPRERGRRGLERRGGAPALERTRHPGARGRVERQLTQLALQRAV